MNTKEVNTELKRLGWRLFMSYGDRRGEFDLSDRYVEMFYKVRHLVSGQRLEIHPGVSTGHYKETFIKIEGSGDYAPSLDSYKAPKNGELVSDITPDYIEKLLLPVIEWAKARDIVTPIKNMLDLPTDAKGVGPIRHFTALAMVGDIDKLRYYQSCLTAGDRLGFVPYIDLSYIERAIEVAEEYVDCPLLAK